MATAVAMPVSLHAGPTPTAVAATISNYRDVAPLPIMNKVTGKPSIVVVDGGQQGQNITVMDRTPLRRAKTATKSLKPESRAQSAWLAPGIDRAPKEPGMDINQRSVLRRWKAILAEQIYVTDELVNEMSKAGLLSEDIVKFIKVERMNKAKLYRMIEAIRASELTSAFELFCQSLSKFYPELVENLIADVEIEKGHVTVDPALIHEAEILVHRRFGGNKRFCELDKKDIADLFAWKLQIAQGEWRRERERLIEALKAEKAKNVSASNRCSEMADVIDTFAARHRKHIVTHAHDMQTPADVLTTNKDNVGRLRDKLTKVLERVDMAIINADKMEAERQRCFSYMKIEHSHNVQLDTALSRFVAAALSKVEAEIEEKEAELLRHKQHVNTLSTPSSSSQMIAQLQ